ncbi:MAG: Na/Pi cotransporter family protein, partial [Clostridiales bacterium]|nr:Na/Pi cotransporter family protein [Clostridiales bacterium]
MDLFDIITLLGGLSFFMYGMNLLSTSLEKISSGKLERSLKRLTSNIVSSMALGAGLTIAMQSSTALTVMLVGFANSGLMSFRQAIGVIFGSNIGTTLTSWFTSLVGINSDNTLLLLLKPQNLGLIAALIGLSFAMLSKKQRRRDIGTVLIGFAILMYSMSMMTSSVSGLKDVPQFINLMTMFSNPIMGVLVGAVFTAILHSSAASVVILQSLAVTGQINFGMALPIMMGFEIGTCATALLSSVNANKNAKRVAVVHLTFNVLGAVLCLSLFYLVDYVFKLGLASSAVTPVLIAIVQSSNNVITSVSLLPFIWLLEKIAYLVVPDSKQNEKYTLVDERLLLTPSFAVAESNNVTKRMSEVAKEMIDLSISLFNKYSINVADTVYEKEKELDMYEDKLGTYLVKLSSKELSHGDNNKIFKMLHSIGDFERIGDHAVNLADAAKEIDERQVEFSPMAK